MHPSELLYSAGHVWCKKESGGNVRIGMTYHYQEQLKNIVYVDLPEVGAHIKRGEPIASFESSKTAADLASPLNGIVIETNALLLEKPGLVNKDPYGEGWMVLVKPDYPEEMNGLLSSKEYIDLILK